MRGRFYHRACFQSMWRGGFEGEGRYYSPLVGCPLQRGRRRTAGRRLGWRPPGPSNPVRTGGGYDQVEKREDEERRLSVLMMKVRHT